MDSVLEDITADWGCMELPRIDHLPEKVTLRSQLVPARHYFPLHIHPWHQFVYTISGILIVMLEHSWYILSPQQAMWVPSGKRHTSGALKEAKFSSLYIPDSLETGMPFACVMVRVTPLLQSLIGEFDDMRSRHESADYISLVEAIILAQLPRQPEQTLHLPWPRTPILRKICDAIYTNLTDDRSLAEWGTKLGASSRTLSRKFEKDLGIGFGEWRNRLRLFKALDRLQSGADITDIALELGYSTPSAFSYMFRQRMGISPSDWRRGGRT